MTDLEQRQRDAMRASALKVLVRCAEFDPEAAHVEADKVLCNLLVSLGYEDVVEAWHKVPRWYA